MKLKDKVVVITGAASGIGYASAILFAKEGAKVVVSDIDSGNGEKTVQEIKKLGGEATFIPADVTRASDMKLLAEEAVNRYQKLDVMFNNAGINPTGDILETDEATWDRVMEINLKGVFLGCKYAIPQMIRRGGGSIINMASVAGLESGPFGQTAYSVSKAGVVAVTRDIAHDFASRGVRANCICPGATATPMIKKILEGMDPAAREEFINLHPMGRLAEPNEVASVAAFLASDESSFVTGAVITVDGGRTTGRYLRHSK